jgi:hypothetical protein
MKKILFILLLPFLSTNTLADVGETYYCDEIRIVIISEKEVKEFDFGAMARKFNFVREADKIIFDKGKGYQRHYLTDRQYPIFWQKGESFQASDDSGTLYYTDGLFNYSNVSAKDIFSIVARCEIF